MARKRKKRSNSGKKSEPKNKKNKQDKASSGLPESFWRQAFVVGLLVVSVLLVFGAFGAGGPLPTGLFDATQWIVGYAAVLVPPTLIYIAVMKLRGEDNKVPRSTSFGLGAFFVGLTGFFHLFIEEDNFLDAANDGDGGGMVGYIVDSGLLSILNTFTAGLILIAITVVAIHYILRLPLTHFLRFLRVAPKKETDEEGEEGDEQAEFTLNEGVPVKRSKRLKEAAEKTADSHALVTTSDPNWNFPGLDLLSDKQDTADAGDIEGNAQIIKDTLADFGIEVEMQGANVGPRVTQYTLKPPSGVRLTKITALENNLALNLAAHSIRIEAPIPGKRAVGIEVPNYKSATVLLRGVLESKEWGRQKSPLGISVGRDIAGEPVVASLDAMPHLLIAGATGSGKSIMINSLLTSLMYRNSPADMKLILVDPKQVELKPFDNIPHLLAPVIAEPEKCISALKWAVSEMERRYSLLGEAGKRNIGEYNAVKKEEGMPYIVVVIDELADLMMVASRDVEALIVRLAQKARAVGIHLVLATQRPSVDVITGLIKANIPARMAFTVTSQVDSRTIIDQAGAEKLLNRGDMLFQTPELAKPRRIQGVFVSEKEVDAVTNHVRSERAPEYDDEITAQPVQISPKGGVVSDMGGGDSDDSLYNDAVQVVIESGKASASLLQRRLRVGYARAARLIETMEDQGIVGPADGARPREVLISSVDELNAGAGDEPGL